MNGQPTVLVQKMLAECLDKASVFFLQFCPNMLLSNSADIFSQSASCHSVCAVKRNPVFLPRCGSVKRKQIKGSEQPTVNYPSQSAAEETVAL